MVSRCLILDNCEDGKLDSTSTGTSMISLRTVVLLLTRSNDGGSQILHQSHKTAFPRTERSTRYFSLSCC